MVLPLRFPPGMAGVLLLAYPRMKKAGSLRLMALGERNFLAFIHSRADFVNFGEWDFRHGEPFAAFRVDEIDIPQLKAGNRGRADICEILAKILAIESEFLRNGMTKFLFGFLYYI